VTDVTADTSIDAADAAGRPVAIRAVQAVTPRYPPELKARDISGETQSTFVIDTVGRIIPGSVRITRETDRGFGDAVCAWSRQVRFAPVIVDGRARTVRVVRYPTTFQLTQ
jgi:TonB family protein